MAVHLCGVSVLESKRGNWNRKINCGGKEDREDGQVLLTSEAI